MAQLGELYLHLSFVVLQYSRHSLMLWAQANSTQISRQNLLLAYLMHHGTHLPVLTSATVAQTLCDDVETMASTAHINSSS